MSTLITTARAYFPPCTENVRVSLAALSESTIRDTRLLFAACLIAASAFASSSVSNIRIDLGSLPGA